MQIEKLVSAICVSAVLCITPAYSAVWTITYPQSEVIDDVRYHYPLALLDLALQKTGVRYELKPSLYPMRQSRSVRRLQENLEINVMWSMTDVQREEQLLPIRIPITRGLIGWRVFIADQQSDFLDKEINELPQLLERSPVQGISWPDTKILQANGFNVVTARDYIEATEMLDNQVADFFPRSVIEVFPELENEYSSNFELKKGLIVYYPAALYFFTNKQNLTLSKLIETGLQRAIQDGSFEVLFEEHFGDTLEQLDIENATFFRLANPLLPPLTPIGEEKYWFSPTQGTNRE